MNVPVVAMAVAAGVSIEAAVTHGLVGVTRRPRDAVRLSFAVQALAAATGALAIIAMYTASTPQAHAAVMKWMFFPAGVVWAAATMWMVALYTGVRPIRWLAALSAGFCAVLILDIALPFGLLHRQLGALSSAHLWGADVIVVADPMPHPLNHLADAVLLAAFVLMFAMAWRAHRRGKRRKAWIVTAVLLLLFVASVVDSLEAYGVLSGLYFTQLSFVAIVFGVSVGLRQESLQVEAELRAYRSHLESLVDERVRDLDTANERLAQEVRERLATEESLRRRVAQLNALQRVSRTLADRSELEAALDKATPEIAALFSARYARVDLTDYDAAPRAGVATGSPRPSASTDDNAAYVVAALEAVAARSTAVFAAPDWAGLPAGIRKRLTAEGVGHLLVVPLTARGKAVGALSVARDQDTPFADEESSLAETVADDLAAAVENERLHERQTRQAAEDERQRLARDLHDAVTQTIYSAALIAEALPAVWERDPADGLYNLTRLRRLVRAALAEMRTLLFELRPAALEAAPLEALLARLGDALAGQIQVPVDIRTDGVVAVPDVKLVLYRVAQEAFSNVAKHSRATRVGADFHSSYDGGLALIVYDDGNGFDPRSVAHDRMGLRIMRERADKIGASLAIDSEPGGGTTITIIWRGQAAAPVPQEAGRA